MNGSPLLIPAGTQGYSVGDLEQFLAAADERTRSLEASIADSRARHTRAVDGAASAIDARRQIATEWLAALGDAAAIRAAADVDVQTISERAERTAHDLRTAVDAEDPAITDRAEQTAHGLRAQSLLQRRVHDVARTRSTTPWWGARMMKRPFDAEPPPAVDVVPIDAARTLTDEVRRTIIALEGELARAQVEADEAEVPATSAPVVAATETVARERLRRMAGELRADAETYAVQVCDDARSRATAMIGAVGRQRSADLPPSSRQSNDDAPCVPPVLRLAPQANSLRD